MGKASKWFRSLLSSKKSPESSPAKEQKKKKSKWALSTSAAGSVNSKNHVEDPLSSPYVEGLDANTHAIAVAAATAAVAEAALAAAQAAAEVVRLTSGGGSGRSRPYFSGDQRPIIAAIKIQSAFRAYLARRALRALKGLVKLQALVRGHIVRKQSSDMLRRMQAMARIQARASAHRSYSSESSNADIKFSYSRHASVKNLGNFEERSNNAKNIGSLLKQNHSRSRIGNNVNKEGSQLASRWLNHWMEQYKWNNPNDENGYGDDNRSDKILEIDTWKPHQNTRRNDKTVPSSHYFSAWNDMVQDYPKNCPSSRLSSKLQKPNPSISSEDFSSVRSSKFPPERDQVAAWATDSTPRMHVGSSRPAGNVRGPVTPARSECSKSVFGDYLRHPSYMANTESSRAKLRSHSAPKQRMQFEDNAKFGHNLWESDAISEKGSTYHLYSGRVKRYGTPASNGSTGLSSAYGQWL